MTQSYFKTAFAIILTTASVSMVTNAYGKPEFADALGVSGQCLLCHTSPDGGSDTVKPAAKKAYDNGQINGLRDFLNPPVPVTDAIPIISPINNEWNAQVGEVPLSIPLIINDEEKSGFLIDLIGATPSLIAKSYSFSMPYLESAKKRPTIDFRWTPSAKQKITKYTVTFRANEVIDNGSKQFSPPIKTSIYLWPARPVSSKNVISQFIVNNTNWATNKLTLNGNITFKKTASAVARTNALKNLRLSLKSNSGVAVGSLAILKPNTQGVWTSTFTLNNTQVPCFVKAEYEKLNAARTVNHAPTLCKK